MLLDIAVIKSLWSLSGDYDAEPGRLKIERAEAWQLRIQFEATGS